MPALIPTAALLVGFCLATAGCESRQPDGAPAGAPLDEPRDGGLDATCECAPRDCGATMDVGSVESGGSGSDAEAGTGSSDAEAGAAAGRFSRFVLQDGGEVQGEWVATYNHNYWWHDAGPAFTFGVFDILRSAPYPDDEGFRFIPSADVISVESMPWPGDRTTYRDLLRQSDLTLEEVPLQGAVHVITGHDSYHLEEDGYGDFGFDLVLTDALGSRKAGDGTKNEDWLTWGAEVVLPTGGYVFEVERDRPDNAPGEYEDGAPANLVGLHLGGSYYLYLLHFQQGSIPDYVEEGKTLFHGAVIGRVGNSGVTLEPHLHLVLLWYDASANPPRSWSVPVEFRDVEVADAPIGPFVPYDYVAPASRTWIRPLTE